MYVFNYIKSLMLSEDDDLAYLNVLFEIILNARHQIFLRFQEPSEI